MATNTTDFYGAMGEQELPSVWGQQLKNFKVWSSELQVLCNLTLGEHN